LYLKIIITKILVLFKITKKTHFCHAPQLWSLTDSRSHLINGKFSENRLIWSILAQLHERLQPLATKRGRGFATHYDGDTMGNRFPKPDLREVTRSGEVCQSLYELSSCGEYQRPPLPSREPSPPPRNALLARDPEKGTARQIGACRAG
jgi:hypothetical protein